MTQKNVFSKALTLILAVLLLVPLVLTVSAEEAGTGYAAEVNGTGYTTLEEALSKAQSGDAVTLLEDVTVGEVFIPAGVTFNGNGKTVTGTLVAGGSITFAGKTTVTTFNPYWYNNVITIGKGASLNVTGTRMTVSYGNVFNIEGEVADAKTADKSQITPSLVVTAGLSLTGNGGGVELNVKNAYVAFGDSTSKNSSATGEFNINFENSIVDFTKTLKTYIPKVDGLDPHFNISAMDSVISTTSHLELWNDNTALTLDNSSLVVGGSFANAGNVTVKNAGDLLVKAPIMSSHGGNTGTITVEGGKFELADSNEDWVNEGVVKAEGEGSTIVINDFNCGTSGTVELGVGATIKASDAQDIEAAIKPDGCETEYDEETGDYVVVKKGLSGAGTEEDPFLITSLSDLELFSDLVNEGNTYKNQYVKLTCDISLAGKNWTPIGTSMDASFMGNFDGGNFTISDLTVSGESNLGFFGVLQTPGSINNLKVTNPTISGKSYLGAIVGMGYTGKINNCHVSGDISIIGNYMVGGITGHGYVRTKDSSVIGNSLSTSIIKATYLEADLEGDNVGGISGHAGSDNEFINCAVKNITIIGTRKIGGIVGIAYMSSEFNGCVVENVVVGTNATEDYANDNLKTMSMGGIVGQYMTSGTNGIVTASTVTGITFTNENNVTVSAGAITGGMRGTSVILPPSADISVENVVIEEVEGANVDYLEIFEAKVGDVKYHTLQEAIDAAQDGDIVEIVGDFTLNAPVTVTKKVTIDLAGYTVYYESKTAGEAMITNKGELTVISSAEGGEIVCKYVGTADTTFGKGNYTIVNYGTIILESGAIRNTTERTMQHMISAVDNNSTLGAVTVIVNGGEITSTCRYAIRQFANSAKENKVVVNGGSLLGSYAIYMQNPSSDSALAPAMTLEVNGGKLEGTNSYDLSVYSYSYGASSENTRVVITDGEFIGDIALGGGNATNSETAVVTGGKFSGFGLFSYKADEIAIPAIEITGGSFAYSYSSKYAEDDGFEFVENEDGTFGVEEIPYSGVVFYGGSLTLTNNVQMNFYYLLSSLEEGAEYFAKVTKTCACGSCETVEYYVDMSDWTVNGDYIAVPVSNIAAKEMNTSVSVVIYKGTSDDLDNAEVASETVENTVRGFAVSAIAYDGTDAEEKTLMVELLNYGAQAQTSFNHCTDALANRVDEKLTQTMLDTYKVTGVEVNNSLSVSVNEGHIYASTLELEDRVVLNWYFQGFEAADRITVKLSAAHFGSNSDHTDLVLTEENVTFTKDGYLKVSVDHLTASDVRTEVRCVIELDGVVVVDFTDSVEGHCARSLNYVPENEKALYESVMKYGQGAINHFGN